MVITSGTHYRSFSDDAFELSIYDALLADTQVLLAFLDISDFVSL